MTITLDVAQRAIACLKTIAAASEVRAITTDNPDVAQALHEARAIVRETQK
jgi:hypothetical protein